MTATLEMPVNVAIAALRVAGTGDNLLAALDALVSVDNTQTEEVVDAVNLENDEVIEL